jgi:plasmid stabilization system protein ParE
MHDLLGLLAANPSMGREAPEIGEGTRRFLYEAHLVFYRPVADGIFVLDILGVRQRQKPLSGTSED